MNKLKINKKIVALAVLALGSLLLAFALDSTAAKYIHYGAGAHEIHNMIIGVSVLFGLLTYTVKKGKQQTAQLLITAFAATVLVQVMKWIIQRPRPEEVMAFSSYAFPSNHATLAFLAVPFAFSMNRTFGVLWTSISISIGIQRIAAGAHYLSDVVAGTLLGIGIGWWGYQTWKKKREQTA